MNFEYIFNTINYDKQKQKPIFPPDEWITAVFFYF
jgi:hypothetical protein